MLPIGSRVGGWLTGVTITVKVRWNVLLPPPAVLPLFITVTVMNNGSTAGGGSNTFQRTFTVMVTPVNQPPTLDPIGNMTFVEGTGTATATATLSNTALGTVGAITVNSPGAGYLSAPAV